ncbi:MAG: hypothetical protein JSV86_10385 [Gemmatimonadota bacterium]|nr:MAG: hypothetical protein JSV86_10385 [Gemmatimonadota bacterium]
MEVKAIHRSEVAAFEGEGWKVEREIDGNRVVMSRQPPSKPRRKPTCGAFVDIDITGHWFVLRTPYDPDFVDELKTRLDYSDRKWDRDLKVWKVGRGGWRDAAQLLNKHYGEGKVNYTEPAQAALTELMEDELDSPDLLAYATLGVRSDAPEGVIHAAYVYIESTYLPMAADELQLRPADIPEQDEARDAYVRILKHRKILPAPAVAGIIHQTKYEALVRAAREPK